MRRLQRSISSKYVPRMIRVCCMDILIFWKGTHGNWYASSHSYTRPLRWPLPVLHLPNSACSEGDALCKCSPPRSETFESPLERQLWSESLRFRSCSICGIPRWQLRFHDGIRCNSMVPCAGDHVDIQRVHKSHRCMERGLHSGGDAEWQATLPGQRL